VARAHNNSLEIQQHKVLLNQVPNHCRIDKLWLSLIKYDSQVSVTPVRSSQQLIRWIWVDSPSHRLPNKEKIKRFGKEMSELQLKPLHDKYNDW